MLLPVDGYDEAQVELAMGRMKESAELSSSVNTWSLVHATCNPEFAGAFEVEGDLLPTLVGWSAKAKRYVKHVGKELDVRQTAAWMDKVASGRIATSVLSKDVASIAFADECVLDLVADDDDDDMDDMLAEMKAEEEERKKGRENEIEEEERERKEKKEKDEEEKARKKKKKKKKRRENVILTLPVTQISS